MAEKILLELEMDDGSTRRAIARIDDGLEKLGAGAGGAKRDLDSLMRAARTADASLEDVAAAQKRVDAAFRAAKTDEERRHYAALATELDRTEREMRAAGAASTRAAREIRGAGTAAAQADRQASGAGGALQRMGGWLKGLVVTAVVSYLGRVAKGLYEVATAVAETESKFATVFEDQADGVDAFLDSFANLAGMTRAEGRAITSTLANIFQAQGFTIAASADLSEQIVRLAADMASFNNVPIEETLTAIQAALRGEFDPLERFAGGVRAATVTTEALRATGKANEDQLTAQDRILATLTLTTRGAGKAVGDLERTQDEAANTGRRMAAVAREGRDAFAEELLVAIEDVQAQLVATVGDGEGFIDWARRMGREVGAVLTDVADLAGAFKSLGDEVEGAGVDLSKLPTGIDQVRFLLGLLEGSVNRATAAFRYLKIAAGEVAEFWGNLAGLDGLKKWGHDFANGARAAIGAAADAERGMKGLGEKVGEAEEEVRDLGNTTADAAGGTDKFKTALEQAGEAVKTLRRELRDLRTTDLHALGQLLEEERALEEEREKLLNRAAQNVGRRGEIIEDEVERLARFIGATENVAKVLEKLLAASAPDFINPIIGVQADGSGIDALREQLKQLKEEAGVEIPDLIPDLDDAKFLKMKQYGKVADDLVAANSELQASFLDLGPAIQAGLGDAVANLSAAVGAMAAGQAGIEDVAAAILGSMGDMAVQLGRMMIAFGTAGLAIKKIFKGHPLAAILAGAALIALGTAAQAAASNLIDSGTSDGASSTSATSNASSATGVGGGSSPAPSSAISPISAPLVLPRQGGPPAPIVHVPEPVVENHYHFHGGADLAIDRIEHRKSVRRQAAREGLDL